MSFRNLLLPYEPLREALIKAEKLDNGTQFEREALNVYMERALRKQFGLTVDSDDSELNTLVKSEAKTAFPNLSDTELNAIAKTRSDAVKSVADEIATTTKSVMDTWNNGLLKKSTASFTSKLNSTFSDSTIDQIIEDALGKLDPSISKEILKSLKINEVKK